MYSQSLQKILAEFVEAERVRRWPLPPLKRGGARWTGFFVVWPSTGVEDIRAVTRQHVRDHQEAG